MKKVFFFLFILLLPIIDTMAQGCSTCTATANNLDRDSAEGLNLGIVYLALTPLVFMAVIGYIWYKKTKSN